MFTNDISRLGHVYLMKYKSVVSKKFEEYEAKVEKQIEKGITALRSD